MSKDKYPSISSQARANWKFNQVRLLHVWCDVITWASVGKPKSENPNSSLLPTGGSWSQAFHVLTVETGDKNTTQFTYDRMPCFKSIVPHIFILYTKMSIFFQKGRSSNYFLERQPGKLMLETRFLQPLKQLFN